MESRRDWTWVVLVSGLLLAGTAASLSAQQGATTGSFRGRITDADGKPVVGAQVTTRNTATGLQRGSLANADGRYAIPLLPYGGPYTVEASSIGHETVRRQGIMLSAGTTVTLDFTLSVQAVALEGIEVSAAAQRVDATQSGVVQRVSQEQVENLPVAGRDFTDFLNLSPLVSPQPAVGTGGQFSVAGMRTSGTNVQIDGADANNIYFGENRGSSRSPFAFSLESIKEFQLITNGYDVEYGSYQGGVVNAVTKTGTNKFDGSAFYYRRDQNLTAKDFNGVKPTTYNVNQFGASLSGPIVKDRLHFFASADVQRKNQPIYAAVPGQANTIEADSLARVVSALQSRYGLQDAGRYFGKFSQAQNNLVLFGRADWTITDRHRLTLRQNYSNFEQTNDRLSTTEAITNTGPFRDKVWSTVGELNSILTPTLFNTLRFQWSYEDRPRPGNPDGGYLPQFTVQNVTGTTSVFFGGDGILFRNRLEEKKLQFIDNVNYRLGAHGLKVGGSVLLGSNANTFWLNGNGVFRYPNLRAFETGTPDQYTRTMRACPVALKANSAGETVVCPNYDVPFAAFDYTEYAAYAQDDFQLTERLLLTAGLRFTGTTFADEPGEFAMVRDTFGRSTNVLPDFTGLSPRLSFTYNLGKQETIFRGGLALLVGRAPTVLAGNAFQTQRPLLSITCTGTNVPTVNMQELLAGSQGENNPAACRSGAAPTGRPEYTLFSTDFKLPQTIKGSLGADHVFRTNTRLSLDLIYSTSTHQFTVQDLNLGARSCQTTAVPGHDPEKVTPCFTLADEGNRPVFIPRASGSTSFNPRSTSGANRFQSNVFSGVYLNTSLGEARSFSAELSLDQRLGSRLQAAVSYAYVNAYDNSSFSCCTSSEGYSGEPTAGNPNVIGGEGEENALWGPSRFERRHTVVGSLLWNAPYGFHVNAIWRSQSGTPWTPAIDGDVNGDGQNFNDRPMVSRDLQYRNGQADIDKLNTLLGRYDCLTDQLGKVVTRNSCRNPWWHSLDARLSKDIYTLRGQRVELLVDVFNVLNGINKDWGRYMSVFSSSLNLLRAESFDQATGRVVYSVHYTPAKPATATSAAVPERGFGVVGPTGFDPFQFQAQIGIRYHF